MRDVVSDEALMLAYRQGDAGAFDTLFRRHRAALYRYFLRQTAAGIAEELSQDCWLRVIGARASYEASAKFTTWLYRIAHNRLIDHIRSSQRTAIVSFDSADDLDAVLAGAPAPAATVPEEAVARAEFGKRLVAALGRLAPAQREAFVLHAEAGMTAEEIARVTEVGMETAKSRLRYACAHLRRALTGTES